MGRASSAIVGSTPREFVILVLVRICLRFLPPREKAVRG